jgi:hypothetical protein
LKVEKLLLVSRLLLLNATLNTPPVGSCCCTPKSQMPFLVLTVSPPLNAFVPLVSVELLVSVENRNGS